MPRAAGRSVAHLEPLHPREREEGSGALKRRAVRWRRRLALALAGLLLAPVLPLALLRWLPPPTSAFMLRARVADPATGRPCREVAWRWVPYARISPHLRLAVVVAEDQRFLLHRGFDVKSIRRALRDAGEGGRLRGASTLSQQVVKNLFLWPGRSWPRKALEAWLTVWLETLWPKRRILEVYLNVAQFGPCTFGAEAAALRFLGTDAAGLGPDQAALLAATLPDPERLRADAPGAWLRARAGEIRELMERQRGAPHLAGL